MKKVIGKLRVLYLPSSGLRPPSPDYHREKEMQKETGYTPLIHKQVVFFGGIGLGCRRKTIEKKLIGEYNHHGELGSGENAHAR
jgi:hypothetical protein